MGLRRKHKSTSNGVFLDIPHTVHELLFAHNLALVETVHPHFKLALEPEGEATLDELHGLFQRNFWSGRDYSVEMVRHDDERMQKKSSLAAIVKDGLFEQLRGGCDLKNAPALRCYGGYQIRPGFLWREPHADRINGISVAKATHLAYLHSEA